MPPEQAENPIQDAIASNTDFGNEICLQIITEAKKMGMDEETATNINFQKLEFTLNRDPFSQKDTLEGRWYNQNKILLGSILFHADGNFYAEYDVAQPHPTRKDWFVVAIDAWGKRDAIKTEARLLQMPT